MADKMKIIPIVTQVQQQGEIQSCAEDEPYALRVIGDSMAPEFLDGHIIIIDPAMPPHHGAYAIIDYQGETTFRQLLLEDDRKFLKALNEAYPMVEMVETYKVRGVVVQRASRRRKDHKNYY